MATVMTATMADRPPPSYRVPALLCHMGGGQLFPQRRPLAMPYNRSAPSARLNDDETQDDWAAALCAALDGQSEQDDADAPEAEDGAAEAESLPPHGRRQPFALETALELRLTPRSYQREAVDSWLRNGGR